MIWIIEHAPLLMVFAIILIALLVIAVCAGIALGEQNLASERHEAFLEGRRSERADNGREPL